MTDKDISNDEYPANAADIIGEAEARIITGCDNDRTWASWHERRIIRWFIAPGTNKRRYSKSWLVGWIRSGVRGAVSGASK